MVKHEDQETEDSAEERDSGIEEAPPGMLFDNSPTMPFFDMNN